MVVRGVWNSEKGQNKSSGNTEVPAKERHEDPLTLNYYRTLLIHQIQPRLTCICSLNSNQTFLAASLETICVVDECLGNQGANVFPERIAKHEHRWTKCIDVKGGLYHKLVKICLDCVIPSW